MADKSNTHSATASKDVVRVRAVELVDRYTNRWLLSGGAFCESCEEPDMVILLIMCDVTNNDRMVAQGAEWRNCRERVMLFLSRCG